MVGRADVSDTGAGTVGVAEASTLTVAVIADGVVHAKAAQSQAIVLIVTAMVEAVVGPLWFANVVVTVKVSDTVEAIWLPYTDGSIVRVKSPVVTVESVMTAQLETAAPLLSVIA